MKTMIMMLLMLTVLDVQARLGQSQSSTEKEMLTKFAEGKITNKKLKTQPRTMTFKSGKYSVEFRGRLSVPLNYNPQISVTTFTRFKTTRLPLEYKSHISTKETLTFTNLVPIKSVMYFIKKLAPKGAKFKKLSPTHYTAKQFSKIIHAKIITESTTAPDGTTTTAIKTVNVEYDQPQLNQKDDTELKKLFDKLISKKNLNNRNQTR